MYRRLLRRDSRLAAVAASAESAAKVRRSTYAGDYESDRRGSVSQYLTDPM